jgi:hypothetical protein
VSKEGTGQSLVSVASADSEALAAILTGRLKSSGIWCTARKYGDMMVADLSSGGGAGGYGYSYDILVRARDEKAARKALR